MKHIRRSLKIVKNVHKKRKSFADSSDSCQFNPLLNSSNSSFPTSDSDPSLCLSSTSNIGVISLKETEDLKDFTQFFKRNSFYGFVPKNISLSFRIISRELKTDDSRIVMDKLVDVLQPTLPDFDRKTISSLVIFKVFPNYLSMTNFEYCSETKINEDKSVSRLFETAILKLGGCVTDNYFFKEVYKLFYMLVMKNLFIKTSRLLKNLMSLTDDSEKFPKIANELLSELGFQNFVCSATDLGVFENYDRIVYSRVMEKYRNVSERTCQFCNVLFRLGDSLVVTPEILVYHETCARKYFSQNCAKVY